MLAASALLALAAFRPEPSAADAKAKPNVVVIMTDDQTAADMRFLDKTRRLIGSKGVNFKRYYDSNPLCCPARATLLTGQYAHNHGVLSNTGPTGGYKRLDKQHTIANWLDGTYRTAWVGKFLNGYGSGGTASKQYIPPGWDDWHVPPSSSETKMYDYVLNNNGTLKHYGGKPRHYQTDVYAKLAASFIGSANAGPEPFFLTISPLAPHDDKTTNEFGRGVHGPEPAPRHRTEFRSLRLPKPPSFDEADVSDKPRYVRDRRRLTSADVSKFTESYRRRARSLLAVDDLVERVIGKLKDTDQLSNTYVFFTSDNGYMLGEHRLETKSYPYEESVRVPLQLRGPGIPAGGSRSQIVANVDLATTILAIAGLPVADDASNETLYGHALDGVSLLPVAEHGDAPALTGGAARPGILLESYSLSKYKGVESGDWSFVRYNTKEKELYNLRKDRWQLRNLAKKANAQSRRTTMQQLLARLADCAGSECS
jgi:arylsulfatase A-like enzyme